METLKMIISTVLTPIAGASEYISTAATSYRKEAQVKYFASVQETLLPESQQDDEKVRTRARVISELWNNE